MPESAPNNLSEERFTTTGSSLLLLLLVGHAGLLYSALLKVRGPILGGSLLLIGFVLYHSWKHQYHLSVEGLEAWFEACFAQIGSVFILVFVGGAGMWSSFQTGAEHSQRGIAFVVLCLGLGVFWRYKHLFSPVNILRTLLAFTGVVAFISCGVGVVGLLTGYQGRALSEPISKGEAIGNIVVGLSIAGIFAIEFWFPSVDTFIRSMIRRGHRDTPWRIL